MPMINVGDIGGGGVSFGVVATAANFLSLSILSNFRQGYREVFAGPRFNSGIDIIAVMLGALFIASLFANPPIW